MTAAQREAATDENRARLRDILPIVRGHRTWIAGAVAMTLTGVALGLAQPLVVKHLIASAGSGRILWAAIALLIVLYVGQALVDAFARYILGRTSEGVVLRTRLTLIDHLLRLDMPAYDRQRIGDLISRASTDGVALRRLVAEGFSDAVTAVIGIAGTVALMIWLDWVLFLVVAPLVVVSSLMLATVLRGIRMASVRSQRSIGEMSSDLERALSAIRTVRASRGEQRESDRIGSDARSVYTASVRMAKLDALVGPAGSLAVSGSFLAVVLIGGLRVADGTSSLADLAAFLLYMNYLTMPIGLAFHALIAIQQGAGALQRINEVLDMTREPAGAVAVAREPRPERDGAAAPAPVLEFRDVWFGYDPRRPVLRGVCLQVPERGQVALIGRSGAGKSTIFALAERFYDPDRGRILLHDRDVRSLSRTECRAMIGLVEQHSPLMYGTVRDNVRYGAPDADEDDISRVIELANLTELVSGLPQGLDTDVGEHGALLSGGERQRIAIARSLLVHPHLLLLDEPTAHLDAENEGALSRAITEVSAECALLVIAHRYSTVRTADRIVVLDQGTVVAAGDHEELLDTNPYYRSVATGWLRSSDAQPVPR